MKERNRIYTLQNWTKEHARFVGRVIFANYLNFPLEKYKDIIRETEGLLYHKEVGNIMLGNYLAILSNTLKTEIIEGMPNYSRQKCIPHGTFPIILIPDFLKSDFICTSPLDGPYTCAALRFIYNSLFPI